MPAIITNGFGALLIHEACGHGLEATAVAPGVSVFSDLIGKKVASSKVTLVDDPTIPNEFGSYTVEADFNHERYFKGLFSRLYKWPKNESSRKPLWKTPKL